MIVIISNLEFH